MTSTFEDDVSVSEEITITASGVELHAKQRMAVKLLGSAARHILLYGGSRSGKTYLLCRAIIIRGLKAPESTHLILREYFNHLKRSIISDTMERVRELSFPGLKWTLNRTDWYHELPNGAQIMYGGLDDKERTEKILGQEHSTIYLNECSTISFSARNKAVTRLAQKAGIRLKMYYDCNPPAVGHWVHTMFVRKRDPASNNPIMNPKNYALMRINPVDNRENLTDEVFEELDALPERERRRFRDGEFVENVSGALWTLERFIHEAPVIDEVDLRRVRSGMTRICVSVDPSGCSGPEDKRSDEIGLVVTGVDRNGVGHVLEDASGRYSPEEWGRAAVSLFDKWAANNIIGEVNYGGDMVRAVVCAARNDVPFKKVVASRGKHVRADPVAALYEKKKVVHHGEMVDYENQLLSFSTSGYMGSRSPDRADAAIFGLTELMLEQPKHSYTLDNIR